jgi:hypothetical protein
VALVAVVVERLGSASQSPPLAPPIRGRTVSSEWRLVPLPDGRARVGELQLGAELQSNERD